MKAYQFISLLLFSFLITSCSDNLTDIGKSIQPSSDEIFVGTDTFHLKSNTIFIDTIFSRPDSFLLGTFYDTKFGTIHADILAQLNCPEGFKFPANAIGDSAKISLSYYSCFGDTLSPLDINIYEMTGQTLSYTTAYPSSLNPDTYCDKTLKLGQKVLVAHKNSSVSKKVDIKLDKAFVDRFRNYNYFKTTGDFLDFFKGIYITTNYGSSTLLNIGRKQVNLFYYYHYEAYKTKDIHNNDSSVYVYDRLPFSASSEVRQINHFTYPDRTSIVKFTTEENYLASPANMHTKIDLPLKRIQTRLNTGINTKKLAINSAQLKIEVTNTQQDTILHPIIKYVLLVKESAFKRFFSNRELPADTCAILGRYTSSLKSGSTTEYEQYYNFDISKLISNELVVNKNSNELLTLRLVPVAVGSTSSSSGSTITSVSQQYLMGAVTLKSGLNSTSPMRLKMVYSGF